MLDVDKFRHQLPTMTVASIKNLVKAIYDERKHNRKMDEKTINALAKLEKEADKALKQRQVLNEKTEADYNSWKRKMDKERRCY